MRALGFAAAIVLSVSAAHAEAWDPFPAFPATGSLAIAKPLDLPAWNVTRTCLAKTWPSGATFHAAVVDVADASGSKTGRNVVPYVDALHREWKGELDADKHVLIAVSLASHAAALHVGNRWSELGFRSAASRAVVESSFDKQTDTPQAVCALAEAVDAKLVALATEESKTIARLRKEMDDLRKRGADVLPAFRALGVIGKWASDEQTKLEKLDDKLESASRAFGEGKISTANEAVASVNETVQLGEAAVDRVTKERASLAVAKAAIAKTLAQIDQGNARDFAPMKLARAKVDRCARDVEQGESALRTYDPWVATPAPSVCLELALPAVHLAESQWRFRARTLPITVATFSLSALGLAAALRRRRRSSVGLAAQDLAETWEQTVERSATRLAALERDHIGYFSAARWTGESAPLDRRTADAVNRAFLMQGAASELVKQARRLIESAGPLAVAGLDEANRLLTTESVRFEPGDSRRRVNLPLIRGWDGTAATLLGALPRAYTDALEALESAAAAVERATTLTEETTTALEAAIAATEKRAKLGMPAAHLADPLHALLERRDEVLSMLAHDPVGCASRSVVLRDELRGISERATLGNETIGALDALEVRVKELRARAAELRSGGMRLDEPGLSLDERLERAERRGRELRVEVERGDEAAAKKTLEVVLRAVDELTRDVGRSVFGRETLVAEVERLRAEGVPESVLAAALADHRAQRYLAALRTLERARERSDAVKRPAPRPPAIEAPTAQQKSAAEALDLRLRSLTHDAKVDTRERPHVLEVVAIARTAVDALLVSLEGSDGRALEHSLHLATAAVDWVAEVARAEHGPLEMAEREIAAARHLIARVRVRTYGEGVTADLASASEHLGNAERAAASKEWTTALATAARARTTAAAEEVRATERARALQSARLAALSNS